MRSAIAILALAGLPAVVHAQTLRGTVSDSATRAGIPGAVVVLLDSAGATIGRTITNERGEYGIAAPPRARTLRVLRLGFRTRGVPVPAPAGPETRLDVAVAAIPARLEGVRVVSDPRCPRRSDEAAAFALLDQARAGLLAAVVARETHAGASIVRLSYERTMDGVSDRVERQRVRVDSTRGMTRFFSAARTAWQFVHYGFVRDSAEQLIYYGPDAEALLDEEFNEGYCFRLRDADRARPKQAGLAFAPMNRRDGRVDIDGTLWVDTAARALRDIEFRYLGLPSEANKVRPGGVITFRELPNGVVLVHRWFFRLPAALSDTSYSRDSALVIRPSISARETGGEVASVRWPPPDSGSWRSTLGAAQIRLVSHEGTEVAGAILRLDDTDYSAATDSMGLARIDNLLPGPYTGSVVHPELAHLGIVLPIDVRFTADRARVHRAIALLPPLSAYVRPGCTGDAPGDEGTPWLIARVVDETGQPVSDANWQLSKATSKGRLTERRRTGADGRIHFCMVVGESELVEIRAWRDGEAPRSALANVAGPRTSARITLPSRKRD